MAPNLAYAPARFPPES